MRHVLAVAIVAILVNVAHAESSITHKKADGLDREARELAAAGRWAEACPKFEASLRTEPTLDRRFELANCDGHIGRLVRAWQLCDASADVTNPYRSTLAAAGACRECAYHTKGSRREP